MKSEPKMKRFWPLKGGKRNLPPSDSLGSFWIDRGDRYHCGIDLYASVNTPVIAVEDGHIVKTGVFTSPEFRSYWNTTYFILFKTSTGPVLKYAELKEVSVMNGQKITGGEMLGTVGIVLNEEKIEHDSPAYIKEIKKRGLLSMLHFEVYEDIPEELHDSHYLGGNCFRSDKPSGLMDPTLYLKHI